MSFWLLSGRLSSGQAARWPKQRREPECFFSITIILRVKSCMGVLEWRVLRSRGLAVTKNSGCVFDVLAG